MCETFGETTRSLRLSVLSKDAAWRMVDGERAMTHKNHSMSTTASGIHMWLRSSRNSLLEHHCSSGEQRMQSSSIHSDAISSHLLPAWLWLLLASMFSISSSSTLFCRPACQIHLVCDLGSFPQQQMCGGCQTCRQRGDMPPGADPSLMEASMSLLQAAVRGHEHKRVSFETCTS